MTAPARVVVATKNPEKLIEVRDILERVLPDTELVWGLEWDDVPETGDTLAANALLKAHAVAAATGLPAIADDTGLEVDALGGRPGVHTARYAGPDAGYEANRRLLLEELQGAATRTARFRTVVAMVTPDVAEMIADGVLEGEITCVERGDGGFGYDPVFAVDGATLAEIDESHKNTISHRARALEALARALTG